MRLSAAMSLEILSCEIGEVWSYLPAPLTIRTARYLTYYQKI